MVSSTLWFSLLPLLACGLATVCWFLIRRRQALTSGAAPRQEESIRLDLLVVLLCLFSIFDNTVGGIDRGESHVPEVP